MLSLAFFMFLNYTNSCKVFKIFKSIGGQFGISYHLVFSSERDVHQRSCSDQDPGRPRDRGRVVLMAGSRTSC